jgi:lipopolysaccharide export system permease protein
MMVINPYSVKLSSQNISADSLKLVDNAIWLRETSDGSIITMRATNVSLNENELIFRDATIFRQTDDFKLAERVESARVILSDAGLDSDNAKIWDAKNNAKQSKWHAYTLLNPRTVLDRYLQPNQISFWDMPSFIQKMMKIGAPVRGHLVQFWTLLFMPLSMIAMTILGVAFSQTRQRRNYSFGVKFGIGIITCFALYFITNLFNALGATAALPTLLAVVAPPLIIIAAAGAFISSFDVI